MSKFPFCSRNQRMVSFLLFCVAIVGLAFQQLNLIPPHSALFKWGANFIVLAISLGVVLRIASILTRRAEAAEPKREGCETCLHTRVRPSSIRLVIYPLSGAVLVISAFLHLRRSELGAAVADALMAAGVAFFIMRDLKKRFVHEKNANA